MNRGRKEGRSNEGRKEGQIERIRGKRRARIKRREKEQEQEQAHDNLKEGMDRSRTVCKRRWQAALNNRNVNERQRKRKKNKKIMMKRRDGKEVNRKEKEL